ncbi:ROK family protein [Amygdalobacter nucleatus]|uniref:ROK family protein n=1 Tax=Amygdalobacter nucleatus TaxID=3029274 RepID=A0A133YFJ2_9FIRM|nr:ROK family protein [Amygdalobacter nucleatus]KXB41962.1 ROK family protein [Amygdalobacter nucleatus]MDF0485725.1 ROK family protein [Amygdalobacter nucleatus]WEG36439.1 ROK family protein [Amygdalobacter nucleatus]
MLLTIDIGGTSVKTALWDAGNLSLKKSFATPDSWEGLKKAIVESVNNYRLYADITGVAFSVPGIPNQVSGRVEGASSLYYIHEPNFLGEISALVKLPLSFENDANCACWAEMNQPECRCIKNLLMLVIGTGIGGSVVYNREIISGSHNFAGEFGMMLVDGHNELAKLGSAVHMARYLSKQKGKELSGEEAFDLAEKGDREAILAVNKLYHYLALGIYNLQYILDPELIIIGGGIAAKPDLVHNINAAMDEILQYGQRSPLKPKIVTAYYGNDANLLGAGYYFQKYNA